MTLMIENIHNEFDMLYDILDDWNDLLRLYNKLICKMYLAIDKSRFIDGEPPRDIIASTGVAINKMKIIEEQIKHLMDSLMYRSPINLKVVKQYDGEDSYKAYHQAREILLENAPSLAIKYDALQISISSSYQL
jgi:hypothetical protein